ncbi:MAG: hypothetical protein Q7S51_08375 [Gallionellaceae bacterium]|nr:hypothetical protein [Gallionellaceae bacterium]
MKFILFIFGMLCATQLLAASEVKDIPTRTGVMQRLLILKPEQPAAILVMFAGGNHALGIRQDGGITWGSASLLLRTSPLFVHSGFTVVIVDAPSDYQAESLGNFRESGEHTRDLAAILAFLRKDTTLPIWLIGTSSGTTSVLNAAIYLQQNGADGIVLTSGISAESGGALITQLAKIRLPTLSIRKVDPCHPAENSSHMSAFKNSSRAEELTVQNPVAVDTDPCRTPPTHGYLGLENQLVSKVSGWIKAFLQHKKFI